MLLENGREDHPACICIGIEMHVRVGDHVGNTGYVNVIKPLRSGQQTHSALTLILFQIQYNAGLIKRTVLSGRGRERGDEI